MFQPLAKYARFKGRAGRSEFWLWCLFHTLVDIALAILVAIVFGRLQFTNAHAAMLAGHLQRAYPFFGLIGLILFLPTLAVSVRRLHDINRTGWWLLLPVGVPAVGTIVTALIAAIWMIAQHPDPHVTGGEGIGAMIGIIAAFACCVVLPTLVAWAAMLSFLVTEGMQGSNRFGPDPRTRAPSAKAKLPS